MAAIRSSNLGFRTAVAVLFALVLAARLLSPAGFMPAFDRGSVAIVICPDAEPVAAGMAGHHHHKPKQHHQPCPYAAASALVALANDLPLLAALLVVGLALLLGRPSSFPERHHTRDRPPLRGPPIPA